MGLPAHLKFEAENGCKKKEKKKKRPPSNKMGDKSGAKVFRFFGKGKNGTIRSQNGFELRCVVLLERRKSVLHDNVMVSRAIEFEESFFFVVQMSL